MPQKCEILSKSENIYPSGQPIKKSTKTATNGKQQRLPLELTRESQPSEAINLAQSGFFKPKNSLN